MPLAGRILGDLISYQNDGKYSTADSRKAGEIVSEYSNAWIDMRHGNARNTHECASAARREASQHSRSSLCRRPR
jgi:hypothetical protein